MNPSNVIASAMQTGVAYFRPTEQELEETRALALQNGCRICCVAANAATFGSCRWFDEIFTVFVYRGRNFNVSPPPMPPHRVTLYQLIAFDPEPGVTYLSEDEQQIAATLANGFTLSEFRRYWPEYLPEVNREFARPHWLYSLPPIDGVILHPYHCRELNAVELGLIADETRLFTWVENQAYSFKLDKWGSKDYESTYNREFNRWDGRQTPGEFEKWFDLRDYQPYGIMPGLQSPPSFGFFNQYSGGGLVYEWEAIKQAYISRVQE